MPNMLLENIDKIFAGCAAAVGAFAILMKWFYLFEAVRGIYIINIKAYKNSINAVFALSTAMLTLLWLSMPQPILLCIFCSLVAAWFFTALLALFLPLFQKKMEHKTSVRKLALPCICKVCILFVLLWLIY